MRPKTQVAQCSESQRPIADGCARMMHKLVTVVLLANLATFDLPTLINLSLGGIFVLMALEIMLPYRLQDADIVKKVRFVL